MGKYSLHGAFGYTYINYEPTVSTLRFLPKKPPQQDTSELEAFHINMFLTKRRCETDETTIHEMKPSRKTRNPKAPWDWNICLPVAWKMPYFQSQGVNQVFWICDDVLYRFMVVCHPSKKSSRLTFLKITRGTPPALSPQFFHGSTFPCSCACKSPCLEP